MNTQTLRAKWAELDRTTLSLIIGIILLQILVIFLYLRVTFSRITNPLILVYPVIWITVGLTVILTTEPVSASPRAKRLAVLVGVGYFGILAAAGGILSLGTLFTGNQGPTGVRVAIASVPPGWGPAIMYNGPYLNVVLIPFELVGYIALTYLVYVTILDVSGSALSGVIGLFSCVSCSWPILGTILSSMFGSTSIVVAFATNQPYGFSTIVFLSAIGLLYWRPFH